MTNIPLPLYTHTHTVHVESAHTYVVNDFSKGESILKQIFTENTATMEAAAR
jgi:hypothetical protein